MKRVLLVILMVVLGSSAFAQVELVPVGHRVYDFLRRMDAKGIIDFNPAVLPVSRRDVSDFLKIIQENESKINKNDKSLLSDYFIEFEHELRTKNFTTEFTENTQRNTDIKKSDEVMRKSDEVMKSGDEVMRKSDEVMKKSDYNMGSSLEHTGMTGRDFINDNKYIIKFIDSNVAVWGHLTGGLYQRNGWGDSLGGKKFFAGDLGFEFRGTMYDRVGFAMSYSNGRVFVGNGDDKRFAVTNDAFFRTAESLKDDGKFFDHFTGYIRYEVPKRWLAVMVGKESVKQGFGFVDNLFFSGIVPYSMVKLDINYKAIGYSFSYGNIKGDSMGVDVPNKMVSTHRVDVKFAKWIRAGFYESVITSNTAFNFVHFNPLSFITSADLNTGGVETFKSNSLLGFDVQVKPIRNVVLQGTFLVDDFNLASINNNDATANDNKFGYQTGAMWNDAFMLDGLSGVMEYTRLDPFVYTHRDNKQQYTDRGYSLGHQLPPNSDEIAIKFGYNIFARLNVSVQAQFQRSGEGFTYDSLGNIDINYGGDINHGERFYGKIKNTFLQGNRVNRSIVTFGVMWEPVRQWVMEMKYVYKYQNLIYDARKLKDSFFYLRVSFKI